LNSSLIQLQKRLIESQFKLVKINEKCPLKESKKEIKEKGLKFKMF